LRPDGRWEAQYVDVRGKRRSVYGATERAARRALREALDDRDAGVVGDRRTTVGDWLDRWHAGLRPTDKRATTRDDYEYRLSLVPDWIRRRRLVELDPLDVEEMLAELLERGGARGQGLSSSTVAKVRTVMSQALQQAVKYGLTARNAAALTDPIKVEHREVEPLSDTEARALLAALAGHRLESLYLVAIEAGLRESELIGLTWDQVGLDAGTIRVARQRTRTNKGTIVEGAPKSRRSQRTVVLTPFALEALRSWRRLLLEERIAAGPGWTDLGLVWPSRVGTAIGHRNLLRHLHSTCAKAGIRRISFHTLRHSAATVMLAAGVDSRVIMDVLGHADQRMVSRYQHVVEELRRDAAAAVERAWRGTSPSQPPSETPSTTDARPREVPRTGV
jgi:integrase